MASSTNGKTLIICVLFLFPCLAGALSIIPGLDLIPPGVRAACRVALANNITQCSTRLEKRHELIPSSELSGLCTDECEAGLASAYSQVLSRCGTGAVNVTGDDGTVTGSFRPLDAAGELRSAYNLTCLQGEAGFCKDMLEDVTEEEQCSDCYMKFIQLDINRPFPRRFYHPDDFNSLKESCGIPTTSYPVSPTPTQDPPSAIPTCTNPHVVNAGETINSIAETLSVATDRLLMYNGLPLNFNETFAGGETLCLDQVIPCFLHQVTNEDTCSSLLTLAGDGVDELMLQSWNPTIGIDCANLKSLMIGKYICIGPPGQTGKFTPVIPSTSSAPPTTATSDYSWADAPDAPTSLVNMTTTWLFPTEGPSIATSTVVPPPAESIAAALARLEFCPFLNEENSTVWDEGLDEEEYRLHSWDLDFECTDEYWDPYCWPDPNGPILPSPTDIPSSCYPTVTTIIPEGWVDPPGPTNIGVPQTCNKWHTVKNGDSCDIIAAKYGISPATFHEYNPSINAQCGNLVAGFSVCVRIWVAPSETETEIPAPTTTTSAGPPGPTETGTNPTCTRWHLHTEGDTCASIAAEYGILVSRFRQLNRSVNSACTNLILGNAYCVG